MYEIKVFKFAYVNKTYIEHQTQPVTESIYQRILSHVPTGHDVMSYRYELYRDGEHEGTIYSYSPLDLIIYKLPKDEVHPSTH